MNAAGRAVLRRAALAGAARCALWMLVESLPRRQRYVASAVRAYGLTPKPTTCGECGASCDSEAMLVVHLNDVHRFDVLKIADILADA